MAMTEAPTLFPFRPEDAKLCPHHQCDKNSIGRAVHYIRRNGWPDPEKIGPDYAAGNAAQRKIAFYTATTPISEDIITATTDSAIDSEHHGLMERLPYNPELRTYPIKPVTEFGSNPFMKLRKAAEHTLGEQLKRIKAAYLNGEMDPVHASIYEASSRLSFLRTGGEDEVLYQKAISTGARASANLLGVIMPVVLRDLPAELQTLQTHLKAGANSYPLLKNLAGDDGAVSVAILNKLEDDKGKGLVQAPFNPAHFMLNDNFGLTISPEFEADFREEYGIWLGEKRAIGCPTIHSKALLDLWRWELEIARKIWSERLPDPAVSNHI